MSVTPPESLGRTGRGHGLPGPSTATLGTGAAPRASLSVRGAAAVLPSVGSCWEAPPSCWPRDPPPPCGRSPRRDGSESRRDRKALSALPLHLPPDPPAVLEPAGVPPCRRGRRARGGNVAELGVTESGPEASPLSPGASCSSEVEVDFVPELLWRRGGAVRRDRVTQRPFQGSGVADTDEPASGLVCSFQQRAPLSNLCAPEEEAVGVWGHRETGNQVGGCGCVLLGTPCNLLVLQGACSFVLGGPWLFRDLIIRILRMGGPGQQRGVKPILPFGSGAQDLHFIVGTLRSAHPSSESRVDLGDLEQNSGADGGPGTTRCR